MEYKRLDLEKLSKRRHTTIPMEKALKDVIPIEWSEDVKDGSKKIIVTNPSALKEQVFV